MDQASPKRFGFLLTALLSIVVIAMVTATVVAGAFNAPPTFLHVVTVQWKADATVAQQQAAIEGIRKVAAEVPGVKNIWIKKVRVQPAAYSAVFAIEFENKAAFDAYTMHPSHKAWESLYLPIREESYTEDITN